MTETYGRYEIVGELGKGTMGVVYKAHDPQIDRMVALKVLRPDRVTSKDFVARFLKEARAIGRLSHSHIVTIYDVGEDHGTVYIAMEYLQGEPFNEVVKSGRLSLAESIEIARQVAETLDYAHRQGIVHRDIKPSNIILADGNQVKLTDFGIARIEDTSSIHQTQAGEILGTPVYMSPEQVMGQKVDGRSDLFSIGVILYEMIAGRRPFGGNNIAAIFRAITQDHPVPPDQGNPFITKALSEMVLKCLAKPPEKRFQTGREMADALSAILPSLKQDGQQGRQNGKRSQRRTSLISAGVFAAVLIAAGSFYFFRSPSDSSSITVESGQGEVTSPKSGDRPVGMNKGEGVNEGALDDQSAELDISSDPAGAEVFVNNDFKGKTPITVPLSKGKYELRLNLTGYFEWEAQVNIEGETPLHIPLRPLE